MLKGICALRLLESWMMAIVATQSPTTTCVHIAACADPKPSRNGASYCPASQGEIGPLGPGSVAVERDDRAADNQHADDHPHSRPRQAARRTRRQRRPDLRPERGWSTPTPCSVLHLSFSSPSPVRLRTHAINVGAAGCEENEAVPRNSLFYAGICRAMLRSSAAERGVGGECRKAWGQAF